MKFKAYYLKNRFRFIHDALLNSGLIESHENSEIISKTAVLYGDHFNVYIDTSDGVNEDLKIYEYCGRIKKIVSLENGKPFLFFKSAYSAVWSQKIEEIARKNNGIVIPFFKWSFNSNFYSQVYGKKDEIIEKFRQTPKEFDVGIFFSNKPYLYPKPSQSDTTISWSDHNKFNLPGSSKNTGHYSIESRKKLIEKLKNSNFSIMTGGFDYSSYIKESFRCKVIINPPGIGEYTSRMVDQTYLGNCIVLRKNTYDNGLTWKNNIQEIDFEDDTWQRHLSSVLENYKSHARLCSEYYHDSWTPNAIVDYLVSNIKEINYEFFKNK